jgi:membrane protein required for colicin V production
MAWIDWVFVVVLVVSVVGAAAQGFFVEMFSLAGVVIGYLVGIWECWRLAPLFMPYVKSEWAAKAAGFAVIFVCVAILAGIIGKVTRWSLKEVGLGWADRLLGGAFGLVRGVLVVAVVVLMVTIFAPDSHVMEQSRLSGYFTLPARVAVLIAPSDLRARFRSGLASLREHVATPAGGGSASADSASGANNGSGR